MLRNTPSVGNRSIEGQIDRRRSAASLIDMPASYQTHDAQRSRRPGTSPLPASNVRNVASDEIVKRSAAQPKPEFFEIGRWFVERQLRRNVSAPAIARQTFSNVEEIEKIDEHRKRRITNQSMMIVLQHLNRGKPEPEVRSGLLWLRFSPAEVDAIISGHYTARGQNRKASDQISPTQARAEQLIQDILGWFGCGLPEHAIRIHLGHNGLSQAQINVLISNYYTSREWRGETNGPTADVK